MARVAEQEFGYLNRIECRKEVFEYVDIGLQMLDYLLTFHLYSLIIFVY